MCAAIVALSLTTQVPPARPRILGVAGLAVFVSDLAAARTFYDELLGFEEVFHLPKADGSVDSAFIKINEHQWIELINRPTSGEGQLDHVALSTDNVAAMRTYLASRGIAVPETIGVDRLGDRSFAVIDPDGHKVQLVEYQRDSRLGQSSGKQLSSRRISDRALHVGILIGELARATRFYSGILGFEELWRGNAVTSPTLSWVNMRVPEGTDYIEFMLYDQKPPPDRRGSAHHLCLMVPSAEKAVATLESRSAHKTYSRTIEIRTGVNRKRQINLFDPDGTRVELMEPNTVDGRPAPSSTLPPPR